MWKWIKNLFFAVFGKLFKFQLLPIHSDNITNHSSSELEVELIPSTDSNKFSQTNNKFQTTITKIQQESEITEEMLHKLVDFALTDLIPHEYKYALKHHKNDVIIIGNMFKGMSNGTIQYIYPLLKQRLAQLGITKVKSPIYNSVFINTQDITNASKAWKQHNQSEKTLHIIQKIFT